MRALFPAYGAEYDTVTLAYPPKASGNVMLTLSGSISATYSYAYNSTKTFRLRTHGGNDTVHVVNSAGLTARPMFELGGDGNDRLYGAAANDTLSRTILTSGVTALSVPSPI